MQDCSNSIANALELLQSYTKPSKYELSCEGVCTRTRAHFLSLAQSKLRLCATNHRAGYLSILACDWQTGWPRSGWPQVGHFDQKIKVNQIASYCAMLYPRCCSLWPCTFWGLHSSAFDSSAVQTRGSHFNFYWGTDTTMWSYVHFLYSCVTKIDFYHLLWNWQVKRLIKQHKK